MHDIQRFEQYKVRSLSVLGEFQQRVSEFETYKGYVGMVKRMRDCGSYLESLECIEGAGHDSKLVHANFCKSRFCPMCMWRRGLKHSQASFEKFSHVLAEYGDSVGLVFLTVTVKNVSDASAVSLDKLIMNFREMRRRKFWQHCLGGVWAIEVTERGRGYHPHLHALLITDKFDITGRPFLISNDELSKIWLDLTGDSFITKVEPVYADKESENPLAKACVELCKYPMSVLEIGAGKLVDLYPVLMGRRMMGSLGVLRGLDLSDDVDLVGASDGGVQCSVCGSGMIKVLHQWRKSTLSYKAFVHTHDESGTA